MESTSCAEVERQGTSFESLENELAELGRLIEDGRPLEDLRLERTIELGKLRAEAGDLELAHESFEEVLELLGTRGDRDGLRLGALAWCARANAYLAAVETESAVEAYRCAYGQLAAAIVSWPDVEISRLLAEVSLELGMRQWNLGQYAVAVASYETGLAVCARFPDDPTFLRLDAQLSLNRGNATNSLKRPEAEAIEWFERSIAKYTQLADPAHTFRGIGSVWIGIGNARVDPIAGRRDYERGIAVLEQHLPDREAKILIAKCCHNIALLLKEPMEALPFQTRAIDLMEEVTERSESPEDRYEVLFFRLARAQMLGDAGMTAAAIAETRAALPELEDIVDRLQPNGGAGLVKLYRTRLETWSEKAAKGVPIVYRTLVAPPALPAEELRCTGCLRGRSKLGLLINGIRAAICNDCLASVTPPNAKPASRTLCMFCDDLRPAAAVTGGAAICADCISICGEILQEAVAAKRLVFKCTFCRRARSECMNLISGPRVFICNGCVTAAAAALPPPVSPAMGPLVNCRFCGIDRQRFVGTPDGVICDDCLDLCGQILEEAYEASHPDPTCGLCGAKRETAERMVLGPDATAVCKPCFARTRSMLDRHHPYDPSLGARRGTREPQLDICGWCDTSDALMFFHGEQLSLCDTCIDHLAQDML